MGITENGGLVAGVDAEDRAIGALLGLAVGDAVAASGVPPRSWTSTTATALAIAESWLDLGREDPNDQAKRCVRWNADGPDPGGLVRLVPLALRCWAEADHSSGLPAVVGSLIGGVPAREVLWPEAWNSDRRPREVVAVCDSEDFEAAVLGAIHNVASLDRGSPALVGLLAGARWGATGIPAQWRSELAHGERVASLAGNLFHAGGGSRSDQWPHDRFLHAWWAPPVLAGEYPGHPDPEQAARRLDLLLDAGIRTMVDLTAPADGLVPYDDVLRSVAATRNIEVRHLRFPIPDFGVIDRAGYDNILRAVREQASAGLVYVHCWGGIGRTGTVVGCLLVDSGMGANEALEAMARARAATTRGSRRAPETDRQVGVIRARARAAGH